MLAHLARWLLEKTVIHFDCLSFHEPTLGLLWTPEKGILLPSVCVFHHFDRRAVNAGVGRAVFETGFDPAGAFDSIDDLSALVCVVPKTFTAYNVIANEDCELAGAAGAVVTLHLFVH